MTYLYRSELLRGGVDGLGKELTKIAADGWRLHSLLEWGDNILAVFERSVG